MNNNFAVQCFDLNQADHVQLEEVFASAYKNRFRNAKHFQQMGSERAHHVFSVMWDMKMLAASVVRADGKRRGIAVRQEHQGQGHSISLLKQSLDFLPGQFVEVSVFNAHYLKKLERLGFHLINDKNEVRNGIRDVQYEPVKIDKFIYVDDRLAYERSFIFTDRTITKRLFMLKTACMKISERLENKL